MKPRMVLLICFAISSAVLLGLLQRDVHCNSASRMATVESLADHGTFVIESSAFVDSTADKVMIDGHFYSSKPPMLSVLAAGGYYLFSRLTGITFASDRSSCVAFVNILIGVLPYLLTLYFFYRLLELWFKSDRTRSLALMIFTLNYIGLGYAVDINNHTPAACCLLISFYLAYSLAHGNSSRSSFWLLSGFLAGLAATFEFWAGIFTISFAVYLMFFNRRRTLILFLPAAALPVIIHFAVNLTATGSLLPVYLRPELYQYRSGYWTAPTGIDALNEPKYIYFFNILLGHHGLFSMTPVFILSAWSIIGSVIHRTGRFRESLTIGIPVLAVILLLGFRTRNYGGVCAGLRWMILAMPLLFVFTAQWIDEHRSRGWNYLLAFLALAGLAMLVDIPWANAGPWHNSAWHKYVFGLY